LIVALLHAAVSVYRGLGGTWLLDTVGGSLEEQERAGNSGVMLAVWASSFPRPTRCPALPRWQQRTLKSRGIENFLSAHEHPAAAATADS
jgi:hypothetical protein